MSKRQPSLKRPLIVQPLIFQLVTLIVCCTAFMALAIRMDVGGRYTDETITPVIAGAIARRADGGLAVRDTPDFTALRSATPDLWFVAEDDAGGRVTLGSVPPQYASLVGALRQVAYAHLRDGIAPFRLSAVIRREASPAGPVTILAHGKLTSVGIVTILASNFVVIPIFALLTLVSLIVTPWIVRRSLAGVRRIAAEAERINTDRRGLRLSEDDVPSEIGPLVRAVNDALQRLDEGYERQRRFISAAAHELRTPIAILGLKVEAGDDPALRQLGGDVRRLANLSEQLLDLERLETSHLVEEVDLGALARRVAADLAPLVIDADRTIEVRLDAPASVQGDARAIERVLVNLIQNAVDHGGSNVIVRVADAAIEVEDDGPGIPVEARERVFEPFHRLRPRSSGTGLGLHLVQQVVERHGGQVSITGAVPHGTIVRANFRPA